MRGIDLAPADEIGARSTAKDRRGVTIGDDRRQAGGVTELVEQTGSSATGRRRKREQRQRESIREKVDGLLTGRRPSCLMLAVAVLSCRRGDVLPARSDSVPGR